MELNMFKLCSGLKSLGYLMILLVLAIISVSYYAVVIVTWGPQLLHGGLQSLLPFAIIAVFHVLLIMLTWSYFMVVVRDPGFVPENWRPVSNEENLEANNSLTLPEYASPETRDSTWSPSGRTEGRPTAGYCARCQSSKPPRCHHCSVKDAYLKWITIAYGLSIVLEHKTTDFSNFGSTREKIGKEEEDTPLYTFLETVLDTVVLLPNFIKFFKDARNHSGPQETLLSPSFQLCLATELTTERVLGSCTIVINLAFALSLLCFVIMHTSLLLSNTTTIEVYEKKRAVRWKYDLGRKKNFEQVFGKKKFLWFFPMYAKEDLENSPALQGLDFPTSSDVEA
ncbi:hypothetical protein C5167_032736 [Papaver somniferum]|uniref:Protein S-acyltransferase n=1 Tax=Papaver somniferum TaxID=3469 RepID=A0A4Y7KBR7_PAPSO|nr:hypothetical protein C5167_032736 [Papaver somniferum]